MFNKNQLKYFLSVQWNSILLSLFLFTLLSAFHIQADDFTVEKISLADGLSQSSVLCLSQDKEGFLWAGTQDGLNKYDGLGFKTYYNIPFDSTSLSSAHIISMLHDSQGRFWIGTTNHGLNLFLPEQEKFKIFYHEPKNKASILNNAIHVIYEGPTGTLWLGTGNGLQRIIVTEDNGKPPSIEFETVFRDTSSTELFAITSIYENKNGEVWIGTIRGLLKLSFKGNDKFLPEAGTLYTSADGLKSDRITAFLTDQFGNHWVGTRSSLSLINAANNKIQQISFPLKSSNSSMDEVNNLYLSSEGVLWISTGQGLFSLQPDEIKNAVSIEPTLHSLKNRPGLFSSGAICFQEDKISKGILWVGTGASGIIKLVSSKGKNIYTNHLHEVMSTAFVFAIVKDKDGIIWIGTIDGLIRFDRSKNKYTLFHSSKDKGKGLENNYITKIRIDKNDQMWLGTQSGLYKVKNRNSEQVEFEPIEVNKQNPKAPIRNINFNKEGNLMVALPSSLFEVSIKDSKARIITYIKSEGKRIPYGLYFLSSMEDRYENIWLGTSQGLYVFPVQTDHMPFDLSKAQFYQHNPKDTTSLRSHTINDIYEDKNGNIWISTPNGFTKVNNTDQGIYFTNYSTRDGLKNNAVYGVLENPEDGTLWLSTNGGLSKFNPIKIKFVNFDIHDGLQSNEFNGGAFFRAYDNEFLFGGIDGYSSFYPSEIKVDSTAPRVFITGIKLTGEKPIDLKIVPGKKVELNYNQNSFNINFVGLQYISPSQNKFSYKLDGFQKEWTKFDNNNQVNFSQLPPGDYVFQVLSCNSDDVISAEPASIAILIHPPFWKTIWFFILIAIFISVVAWLLHAYLLRIKLKQIDEIEMIRKETAADFHDELGHKLTTISWFSEILKKKIDPEQKELRSHLDRIIETAGGLYHTMRDMVWALDPGQDSMKDLYDQIQEFGESLFDQTGVEFKAQELNGEFKEVFIPLTQKRHVLLIFKEAMHNSFKHSESKLVKLELFRENNHITIKLSDNGKGFDLDWNATGNGLKNVRKRSKEIGGKLNITSTAEGTNLELEVPIKS